VGKVGAHDTSEVGAGAACTPGRSERSVGIDKERTRVACGALTAQREKTGIVSVSTREARDEEHITRHDEFLVFVVESSSLLLALEGISKMCV